MKAEQRSLTKSLHRLDPQKNEDRSYSVLPLAGAKDKQLNKTSRYPTYEQLVDGNATGIDAAPKRLGISNWRKP